jgi:hypothetical protein
MVLASSVLACAVRDGSITSRPPCLLPGDSVRLCACRRQLQAPSRCQEERPVVYQTHISCLQVGRWVDQEAYENYFAVSSNSSGSLSLVLLQTPADLPGATTADLQVRPLLLIDLGPTQPPPSGAAAAQAAEAAGAARVVPVTVFVLLCSCLCTWVAAGLAPWCCDSPLSHICAECIFL